ncbi:MAG: FAD-dependent oxidoreductase [Cohnella sp.]|nr:FAD-dependent oxidoreductase [Cohnella sp.]
MQRAVPVHDAADVIVVGGGPAGTAAAIGAARCGRKTIVLEHTGQLGGMGTLGNVSVFMGVGNVTGIYREIIAEFLPASLPSSHHESAKAPQYSPFELRHYLNHKLEQEGVQVYFHAGFVSAVMEGNRVVGVIANTREGLRAFEGRVVIDCTGDARVAVDAGVPTRSGREEDGLTQPMTLMFMMQDTGKPVVPYLPDDCYRYDSVEQLPQGRLLHWSMMGNGTLLVNMTRVKGNGARIEDINYAEKESLRQALSVANYLQRTSHPNHILSHVPGQVGVRETNQIVGRYTLTEDDLTSGRRFYDVVAQTNYEIDIHNPTGGANTDERKLDGYDIPYRCMLPADVDGLIVAGRSISATHVAMSSMRVQATCFALGQAAGIAASIAIESDVPPADVSVPELHAIMERQGVVFKR